MRRAVLLFLLSIAGSLLSIQGAGLVAQQDAASHDWPQWRGPGRDGIGAAPGAVAGFDIAWRIEVGIGHASPVTVGATVYQFARQGERETLIAIDTASGDVRWQSGYQAPYRMNPAATAHGEGPKSTPVVADGRVVTLGIDGALSAWSAADGELLWQHRFEDEFPTVSPIYGAAMSPIVVGDLLIAHVGGHHDGALTGFDVADGRVRWRLEGDGPGYASPVLAMVEGHAQLITQTDSHVVGVGLDGELLWRVPFTTDYDQNSVTPLVDGEQILVSGLDQGVMALVPRRIDGAWEVNELWRNRDVSMYMSSPVLVAGRLFGFSHRRAGQLFALDPDTGATLWTGPGRQGENAALLALGDGLLVQTEGARLLLFDAGSNEPSPGLDLQIAPSPTWAHPVPLADGLLVKDHRTLTRIRWRR